MDVTGSELRQAREAARLTQQAIADGLSVSRQTVVTWEQRAVVNPARAENYLRVVRELATSARRVQEQENEQ